MMINNQQVSQMSSRNSWIRSMFWINAILIIVLIILRQPAFLIHAQFWAEDGACWYKEAYEMGVASLWLPQTGYLQSISRVAALCAVQLPLIWGPIIFAFVALIIQALPPIFLLSSRFDSVWSSRMGRVAMAYIYVALPNASEVHFNLTNAQWHLALLGFLIIVSESPRRTTEWIFDIGMLMLVGLSGPFCIFLVPVAIWQYLQDRNRAAISRAGVIITTAIIQSWFLLHSMISSRPHAPLGATFPVLAQMLSGQIVIGGLFGARYGQKILSLPIMSSAWVAILLSLFAVAFTALALARGPKIYRMFLFFAIIQLIAALISPAISNTDPQWPIMSMPGFGGRYFLIPMLAGFATLLVLVSLRQVFLRYAAAILLSIALIGVFGDWKYPIPHQNGFEVKAKAFDKAPSGTMMTFPITPNGFSMELTKH